MPQSKTRFVLQLPEVERAPVNSTGKFRSINATLTWLCLIAGSFTCTSLRAQDWPTLDTAEAQPLLVQVDRLREALNFIGYPLSASQANQLSELENESDDKVIARQVQRILDPLALAAVVIEKDNLTVVPHPQSHELTQQGWRSFLVKVINKAGITSQLAFDSPHARAIPNSKSDQVNQRWMKIAAFDGRPLQPSLSGQELEYRIVQIYCDDRTGQITGRVNFLVDLQNGSQSDLIRNWNFQAGTDGWYAMNQVELSTDDGLLIARGTDSDPFMGVKIDGGPTGPMLIRFRAAAADDGMAQVFWWTEEKPFPDGGRVVNLPLTKGGMNDYEAVLPVEGKLLGIRIDPNVKASVTKFERITLTHDRKAHQETRGTEFKFTVAPSIPVHFSVNDLPSYPAVAAFEIRDKFGRVYPDQSKRLAPDLFFQPQIYRYDGEVIHLPPGEYTVRCSRGPHSIPETKPLVLTGEPATVHYQVKRWFNPTLHGWWSGDHHIHAAGCLHYTNPTEGVLPVDMLRHTMGEDLNVGCCLTWGPGFDYQKQFFTGKVDNVSKYPYLLRYDVEVSGFGSHVSGHLNLLRLQQQIYPGGDSKHHWPTLGLNTLKWAKSQNAICGPAHSAIGLSNIVGRIAGYEDGPHGLPNFNVPAMDGIGACEYVVDITHELPGPDGQLLPAVDFISTMDTSRQEEWNMWYHTLNCGFRVRASGETDFPCISGQRVGMGRVYVKVDDRLNFDDWVQGIQDGRSYVSDGQVHIVDFAARATTGGPSAELGVNGSELRVSEPTQLQVTASAAARLIEGDSSTAAGPVTVELIVNGRVRDSETIDASGELTDLTFTADIDRSSWVALRVFPHCHTNPIFVLVDEKPIRASRGSVEWMLACLEQCWQQKQPTYAPAEQNDARAAFDHARRVYQQLLDESPENQ